MSTHIYFWAGAWESITAVELGRLEVGWTLMGRDEGDEIVVEQAHYTATGSESSVTLDVSRFGRLERVKAPPNYKGPPGHPRELRIVGDLHNHPGSPGQLPRASKTDLDHWRAAAEGLAQRYAGVVLTPRRELWAAGFPTCEDDWDDPYLGGWVASPDGTIRPALVIVEDPVIGSLRQERRYWDETLKREETHGSA